MKTLLKNSFKEIINTKKRFISLLVIAFLGVGFYAGLRVTSTDMTNTLNNYYNDNLMFDISLSSTYGITDDLLDYLYIDEVEYVEGSYSLDFIINTYDTNIVGKIHSITNLNSLNLVKGSMPTSLSECVVESDLLADLGLSIGDTITVEDSTNYLKSDTLTIVGVVKSPIYTSIDRGSTTLGTGSIDYFIYVDKSAFIIDYYTEVYIRLFDSSNYDVGSREYEEYLNNVSSKLDTIIDSLENIQYEKVTQDIIDGVNEYYLNMGFDTFNIDYSSYLDTIDEPVWYTTTRLDNYGYSGFVRDTSSIENIGKVFPLVFFLVAILITLSSMSRMVEEEKTQIGTLKALGFRQSEISIKYILYASLACLIGGLLGIILGFTYIPRLIWLMYENLYTMPYITTEFNTYIAAISLGITYVCVVGATIISLISKLKIAPAELMRPSSHVVGKKIFLERIKVIWEKLKFSTKITFRNIFRYKKRGLMTVVGIAGATALVLAAFGLQDEVSDIVEKEYNYIYDYDLNVVINEDNTIINELNNNNKIEVIASTYTSTVNIKYLDNEWDVYLVVVEDTDDFSDVVNLYDTDTGDKLALDDNSFILTDQVAGLLGVSAGDTIDVDGLSITITNICENYISHYAYITKSTYEELFNQEYNTNSLYVKTIDLTEEDEDILASDILANTDVLSISLVSNAKTLMDQALSSLNYVIWILIICAGLLTFAVLYNLSNINISERIRELSTIKVLGFTDLEVYQYIAREMTILITIGVLLGLGLGVLLTDYITTIAEVDAYRFGDTIYLSSYVYTIIITIVFNVIVDIFNYKTLKKINMVESLKAYE